MTVKGCHGAQSCKFGRSPTAFREATDLWSETQKRLRRAEETTVLSWTDNKEQELSSAALLDALHLLHFKKNNTPPTLEIMTLQRGSGGLSMDNNSCHHPKGWPSTPSPQPPSRVRNEMVLTKICYFTTSLSQDCKHRPCRLHHRLLPPSGVPLSGVGDPYFCHHVGLAVHGRALKTIFGGFCLMGKTKKPPVGY